MAITTAASALAQGFWLWVVHFPQGHAARRECTMNKASLNYVFFFFGIVLTAVFGSRLGHIVGVTWEFGAFAASIVVSAVGLAGLQTGKRIDDLEKKVSELENARKVQA
jgi:hypothetical protein